MILALVGKLDFEMAVIKFTFNSSICVPIRVRLRGLDGFNLPKHIPHLCGVSCVKGQYSGDRWSNNEPPPSNLTPGHPGASTAQP